MKRETIRTGARTAALTFAAAGAMLGLAACEQHSYPTAAPQETTAAPVSGDTSLAGAPNTRAPSYAPPPSYAPAYPPPEAYRPGPASAPEVVTMAPIPNPPEEPAHYGHRPHRHRYVYEAGRGYVFHPYHRHHHHHLRYGGSGWVFHPTTHPGAPHPAKAVPTSPAAASQLTKPAAPIHGRHHHPADTAAAAAAAAAGGPVAAGANVTGGAAATASEADSYQALQQRLQTLFTNEARLDVPGHMEANQPATVTLTFPADFAESAQAEAAKNGVGSSAASLNLIATLAGDGYTVAPMDPQTLPLAANTPTVFQWKVTPTGAARAPLKASAKAQGVGDSHVLDLGGKTSTEDSGAGRLIGLGLLAIVVVSFLAWLGTRRPAKPVIRRPPPMQFDAPN